MKLSIFSYDNQITLQCTTALTAGSTSCFKGGEEEISSNFWVSHTLNTDAKKCRLLAPLIIRKSGSRMPSCTLQSSDKKTSWNHEH